MRMPISQRRWVTPVGQQAVNADRGEQSRQNAE
jgi:hypothetical protein